MMRFAGTVFLVFALCLNAVAEEQVTAESMEKAFGALVGKYLRATMELRRQGYEREADKCMRLLRFARTNEVRSRDLDNPRYASNRANEIEHLQGRLAELTQSLSECDGTPI